jgi:hypothetical protein
MQIKEISSENTSDQDQAED